jgi:hypothetical protein
MDVQCGLGFVLSEDFEKMKESQWAREKDQSSLTP